MTRIRILPLDIEIEAARDATVMGAAQTELLYGPREFDRWVNAVLTAWPALLWVFLVLFFLPLLTLLVRSVLHRMQ